jgi:hypothetical protein
MELGRGLFKACCFFECWEKLTHGTSPTLSFDASSFAHSYKKMRLLAKSKQSFIIFLFFTMILMVNIGLPLGRDLFKVKSRTYLARQDA